jgi:Holliday junction resolvasome RuvABC ATP-dependent DNA helicase subunit
MYSDEQLNTIHVIAHKFAQLQKHQDTRIREVARTCRVIERLCESIRKGARDSALPQAMNTLQKQMAKAIDLYRMKSNDGPPPGWT